MKMTLKQKNNAFLGMTKRNILVFFQDKATLFFSMLAPLIVFLLYVLFLKNTYSNSIKGTLAGLENYVDMRDIDTLLYAYLLAGVLGTASVTVSLMSLNIMVADKEKKIDFDYNSSPIHGPITVLSYFAGAFINTMFINSGILSIGLIVLYSIGNMYLSAMEILNLYLVTALGAAKSTLIMMVVVSFFKKSSALGAFSGIISSAIGFVIGAYIPLSNFSKPIQGMMSLFPGSHIAALYRNLLLNTIIEHVNASLGGMDQGLFASSIRNALSLNLKMFQYSTPLLFMVVYVAGAGLVALILNIVLYRFSSKRA